MMATQQLFGRPIPIVQAPMAGTATPALAAAVSNAGALGSLGLASSTVDTARAMAAETRALTDQPFNLNLFTSRRHLTKWSGVSSPGCPPGAEFVTGAELIIDRKMQIWESHEKACYHLLEAVHCKISLRVTVYMNNTVWLKHFLSY